MKIKYIALGLLGGVICQPAFSQANDPYWCKYTNTCDQQPTRPQNVPQQDPYSTPLYNDGGPTGYTGSNNAPYYDPYNTPAEDMVVPYYGYPIIGVGGTYINNNSYPHNQSNNNDFSVKK